MLPKRLRDFGFKESDFEYFYTERFYKLKPKPKSKPKTINECYILSLQHQPYGCQLIKNGYKLCKECFRSINLNDALPKIETQNTI